MKKLINYFLTSYQKHKTARWNAFAVKRWPDQKYCIQFSFDIAGVRYYQFEDTLNIPFARGLMSLAILDEIRMKLTPEYLDLHFEAKDKIYAKINSGNKVNIDDVRKLQELDEQAKQCRSLTFNADSLYKLASVVFFDANENPTEYDAEHAIKKIEFWKKHKGTHGFFFQKPVTELLPFIAQLGDDFETFFKLSEMMNQVYLENFRATN